MGEVADEERASVTPRDPANHPPSYIGLSAQPIAPWRQSLDTSVSRAIDWSAEFLAKHWLWLVNLLVGIYAFLPFVAPLLMAVGIAGPADAIYYVYHYFCHQLPERSWYLFGYQMAYCQRDALIYPSMFVAGVAFSFQRDIKPLPLKWFLLLILPMAIDGFTQLFGWRESTPMLRAITGTIFGVATVWLFYPLVQRFMNQ